MALQTTQVGRFKQQYANGIKILVTLKIEAWLFQTTQAEALQTRNI